MVKSNKIKKTEELIAGYQKAECLPCIVYVVQMANGLNKPKQKVWYVR